MRICEVFSRDGKGNLSFEDFLELLSVFSEQAPRDIKVFYAFRIYGECFSRDILTVLLSFAALIQISMATITLDQVISIKL